MNKAEMMMLPIEQIELDIDNPRIKHFLEIYKGEINSEQISLALKGGSNDSGTSYDSLKESINVSKTIIHPIVVIRKGEDQYRVIEGNTRLMIYKEFHKGNPDGTWARIPSLVYDELSLVEIHQIRLQSHLVGPRAWDPYSKAKYLFHLSEEEHLPINAIISMCGGKKTEILSMIDAYKMMEESYRACVEEDDSEFNPQEFSKFLEFQNRKRQLSMISAGFSMEDFSKWVVEGKIDTAQGVRRLGDVLANKEAKEVLLKKKLSDAIKIIAVQEVSPELNKNPYEALCNALYDKLDNIEFKEIMNLATDPAYENKKSALMSLSELLDGTLKSIKRLE